jgi:ketosteroid isomerase-like protein
MRRRHNHRGKSSEGGCRQAGTASQVEGSFEITVHDVLVNDEHGLVIARGRAIQNGTAFEWRAHGLYRFRDGRIAECWVLPENQHEFDRIWS